MINDYLDNPWIPPHGSENDLCTYQNKMSALQIGEGDIYNETHVRTSLCLPSLVVNQSGPIYSYCMTQYVQLWTIFILSNVWLVSHISDLPLTKPKLISSIWDGDSVDNAAIILDALASCIVRGVPSMILPSLIDALCRYQEIPNPYDEVMALKTEVDTYYINKHCKEKSVSHVQAELKKRFGDLGYSK
ncbi:unnamed protein product [Lupinus luteus]|uniref:Uncharacterized protein n=1 Tax=Lupinus luteus TaxID=3873 RepID=A0AAV1X1B3_LUPLU